MSGDSVSEFELDIGSSTFTSSVLYHAVKSGRASAVLAALHSAEDPHHSDSQFGTTFLHLAVLVCNPAQEERFLPMVYMLCNAGCDPNAKDYKGLTPLQLAIQRGLLHMMSALLRCGTDPTPDYSPALRVLSRVKQDNARHVLDKFSPGLWAAVADNNVAMVHMLLNSWCRVNIHRHNQTLIQYAHDVQCEPEITLLLDDFEVTLEFVHATLAGDERRMLEFLMDAKPCDPSIMDISYQPSWTDLPTPRSLRDTALAMGHQSVLHLLPEPDTEPSQHVHHLISTASHNLTPPDHDPPSARSQASADEFVYQFFHPTKFHAGDTLEAAPDAGDGAEEPLRVQRKCYYFHELDGSTEHDPLTAKLKGSLRRSNNNYKHNWKELEAGGKNKGFKSKLCVIS